MGNGTSDGVLEQRVKQNFETAITEVYDVLWAESILKCKKYFM